MQGQSYRDPYPIGMSRSVRIAALDLRANRGVYLAAVAVGAI